MVRTIAVPVVDRANFGRLLPVLRAIAARSDLSLKVIASGSTLLDRFGRTERYIEEAGFQLDSRVYVELEGGLPVTMAKSLGFCVIEAATVLNNLQPDIMLLIGDRYEAVGFALAAAYQNIPIAHIQGGELSGSIDESARHVITKLAQFHFPSTRLAAEVLLQLGEAPHSVMRSGCPSGDIIMSLDRTMPDDIFETGVGGDVHPHKPYVLTIFHPVTTEFEQQEAQCEQLLAALERLHLPTIWLWPNIDAGGDHISKIIRRYRETAADHSWLRMIKGFDPQGYQKVLANASLAVGNSSSFIRDSSFTGTPVVLVGERQSGRERATNVIDVPADAAAIYAASERQLQIGRYPPSNLYGDGNAGPFIAEKLATIELYVQKKMKISAKAHL